MSRELIFNDQFPQKPHNSPAAKIHGLIFLAGQTATGEIKGATKTALDNLRGVLELSGSSVDKIVKINVWLQDMKDFGSMNEVYVAWFNNGPCPPRTCIEAGCLPGGSSIEIEAIAQA